MTTWLLHPDSGSKSNEDDEDNDNNNNNNNNHNCPSRCLIVNPYVIKVVQVDELCQVCVLW